MNEIGFRFGKSNEARRAEVSDHLKVLVKHRLVKDLQPELLGEGGFHSVFILKNKKGLPRNMVAKVRREFLIDAINSDSGPAVEQKRLALKLRQEQSSARMLKKYFGAMVLVEKIMIVPVPVTADILHSLEPNLSDQEEGQKVDVSLGEEIPALVILQEKAPPEAFAQGSIGMQTYFLESHPDVINRSAISDYQLLNEAFVDNVPTQNLDLAYSLMSEDSDASSLFDEIEKDIELREQIKLFVKSAVKYSNETGAMVDFVGSNNIRIFSREENDIKKWYIRLIDARISGGHFAKGKIYLKKMLNLEALTGEEIAIVEMTITYVRFLNALASRLGIEERLVLSEQSIADKSELLLEYFAPVQEDLDKPVLVAA